MNNNINELNNYILKNNQIDNEHLKKSQKKYVNTLTPSGNASYLSINNSLSDNIKLFTSPILSILPNSLLVNLSNYVNPKENNYNKVGQEKTVDDIYRLEKDYSKKDLKKIKEVKKSDYFSVANIPNIINGIIDNVKETLNIPDIEIKQPDYITEDGVTPIEESTDCKRLRNREVELTLNYNRKRTAPKPNNKDSKDYKKNIKTLNKLENKVIKNISDVDNKIKTLINKRKNKINNISDIDKDYIKEAKAETKSFFVDKKVSDQEAIDKRINAILEYKENKAEFFKKYIMYNINSQDIDM